MTVAPGELRLLTIEGDYSLHTIRTRALEHEVLSRDAGGLFRRVWSVNPLAGADPNEPASSSVGPPTTTELAPGQVMIEGHVALTPALRWCPPLNLLLAQLLLLVRLQRTIRRERVTAVRAGDPYYLGLLALVLARLNRLPLVVKVAANYEAVFLQTGRPTYPRLLRSRRIERWIERKVLARADLVAAANLDNLEAAVAAGARRDRCSVFRYGTWVDPVHFREPVSSGFRATVGAGPGPLAVFVGRLEPVKHPDDPLRALAVAVAEVPGIELLVVGDGSQRATLEALAAELGIAACVHFVGAKDQQAVRAAMVEADVILAPLAGRALVEAALSGTPVVAYDVEWHSELIEDGRSGRLVPFRDHAAMGRALAELAADPELRHAIGAEGRARCLEMMDPAMLIAHEQHEYRRFLGLA